MGVLVISVSLEDGDTTAIAGAIAYFASQPVRLLPPSLIGSIDPPPNESDAEHAYSASGGPYVLTGTGFSYDASGRLVSGTITGIGSYTFGPSGGPVNNYIAEAFNGLSLPVSDLPLLAQSLNPAVAVLAAGATVVADSPIVHTFGGDDTIVINGGGERNPAQVPPFQNPTTIAVDAGGGVNTAVFARSFRDQANITGGGGNETVHTMNGMGGGSAAGQILIVPYEYLATATLVAVDKVQFIDGSIYENNATPDAQAALMFKGVFGRLPDALNAGTLGQLAVSSGRLAAANAMLAAPEGRADTAGLSNAAFVTRLYQNILGRLPDAPGLAGWVNDLDTGRLGRGDVVERFAGSPEAQTANAATFASGRVFAADPNAIEVLRAYSTLLNRLPEYTALKANVGYLADGLSLQDFYAGIQKSAEFAADGLHQGGITATTAFSSVYGVLHSASVTATVSTLVSATTGVAHQL